MIVLFRQVQTTTGFKLVGNYIYISYFKGEVTLTWRGRGCRTLLMLFCGQRVCRAKDKLSQDASVKRGFQHKEPEQMCYSKRLRYFRSSSSASEVGFSVT